MAAFHKKSNRYDPECIPENAYYQTNSKGVREQRAELCNKLQCMSDAYASSVSTLQLVSKDHQWHTELKKVSSVTTSNNGNGGSSKRSRTGGGGGGGGGGGADSGRGTR